MKSLSKLSFIVLAMVLLQTNGKPSRVRRQGFDWENYDEFIDTDTNNQRPQPQPQPQPQPRPSPIPGSSTQATTTTTTPSPEYSACIRRCPTTPQYNPICGTNRVTYNNDSHLRCANSCGLSVQRAFGGSCRGR